MKNLILIEIKESSLKIIDSLTIHGIPSLFRSKFIITKIFWFLLTIFSTAVTIKFLLATVNEFLERKITTEVTLVDGEEFEFPSFTFCNKNKFSTNASFKYLLNVLNLDSVVDSPIDTEKLILTQEIKQVIKVLPAYLVYQNFDIETRKLLTKSIDEMFLTGRFDMINLNPTDFKWVYNRLYGNCYQFNSNGSFITKIASEYSGIVLLLLMAPL